MNRKSILFVLPLIALVLMSCNFANVTINRQTLHGSGNLKTEQRTVSDVERVSLEGLGDLTLVQGSEEGLTVEADDNLLPYLETYMNGRELVLRTKPGYNISSGSTIRYTLKFKNLNRVSVSGAGNVTADQLKVGDLALNVSGSGNMNVADLQAQNLTVTSSGSGNFNLKGKVTGQTITISGAGNYTAGDMESSTASVTISGAGNVTIWVNEKLDTRITGFGSVNYYGQPSTSQSVTGGGGVKGLGTHK